jgi:hypothetical protein
MDGSRFDDWTRRRFGLAAGGVVAALLGLNALDVEAKKKKKKKKKKRKKKRCRKLAQVCTQGGKKKCCSGQLCGHSLFSNVGDRCCLPGGATCTAATATDCCTTSCGADNRCFCKGPGQPCNSNSQCCSNVCTASVDSSVCA